MPGMSGLDLIAEIKRNWKHIKCILLTGYADFEYTKQALKLRSSDYLLKPVEDAELMEAVRRALGRAQTGMAGNHLYSESCLCTSGAAAQA
jgi:two-component system response regulator YesN